jgi:CRISPR/Cas system-associated exonuclease Cas4 (RecB family)
MTRPIVQLHTTQQWLAQSVELRSFLLQNIKLKDRLYRHLEAQNKRDNELLEAKWVRCRKCSDSEYPGYVLLEPRYDGLHPSQIGHPCLLKVYNDMVGAPGAQRVEPRMRLLFDLGHAVHHMFQSYGEAGAWGPIYRKEVEVSGKFQQLAEQLMLEGHADADNVLTIDIEGHPLYEIGLVHEYKTCNSNIFDKLKRPKPEHKQQAMLYGAALDRPVIVYLYMNKNDSNLLDFPVEFEPPLWEQLYTKAALIKSFYDSGTPPPGEVGFHCRDCAYVYGCPAAKQAQAARR